MPTTAILAATSIGENGNNDSNNNHHWKISIYHLFLGKKYEWCQCQSNREKVFLSCLKLCPPRNDHPNSLLVDVSLLSSSSWCLVLSKILFIYNSNIFLPFDAYFCFQTKKKYRKMIIINDNDTHTHWHTPNTEKFKFTRIIRSGEWNWCQCTKSTGCDQRIHHNRIPFFLHHFHQHQHHLMKN